MIPGKSSFIEHINVAIKKNWNKECSDILNKVISEENQYDSNSFSDSRYSSNTISNMTLIRIKERVELLEELNDQLLNFIFSFIENLPDIVLKTIHTNKSDKINYEQDLFSYQERSRVRSNQNLRDPIQTPTRREWDVLELLAKGYCAKEIAKQLFISETTVITHKKNLKKKYNVKNTVELISKFRNVNYQT